MGHVNHFTGRVHSFNGSKPPCLVPIIDKQRMNPFDAVTFGSVNDTYFSLKKRIIGNVYSSGVQYKSICIHTDNTKHIFKHRSRMGKER